ncbi:MAG: hypothetical protein OEW64_03680 [Gammaproteobacteria bacterium]|nr:hypothetical protein [Gammaproteobacteria bacterium]MDH5303178.1 hypothetical protein [Gammaproteobacteria bacterium]MDH5320814.1 hypothetical protein [Gammaproteobacteria bacterium]
MKAVVFRKLNNIFSLSILALMAVALIAGQAKLPQEAAGSGEFYLQITSIRHNDE